MKHYEHLGIFSDLVDEARLQGLCDHFAGVRRPDAYTGEFYPGPHKFDAQMQAADSAWLRVRLA